MVFFYRFLTFFFYPFLVVLIYLRKIIRKEDSKRYKEKIFSKNFFPNRKNEKKLLWFHAASIGEVQSIFPIIFRLNEENNNLEFLITTVTLSSGKLVEKKINHHSNIYHRYFPLDVSFLVKKFLESWRPSLAIFVDSEIWPNFILEIKKKDIPSIIINGRITKKTFKRWKLMPKFAKKIFNSFDLCLSSSKESTEHFKYLGVMNLKYLGNIKLASSVEIGHISDQDKEILEKGIFWCAASTHQGEEAVCLRTHLYCKNKLKNLITIIVPRHINRSKEIFLLCDRLGLSSQILNDGEIIRKDKEIIIVNSFGALLKFFKYSKSVFMGKSLIKKLQKESGQNPIEAAKLNCKIYHGPYVDNFKEIYDLLKSHGISKEILNEKELGEKLLKDFKFFEKNQNTASRIINDIGDKILGQTLIEIKGLLRYD